MPTPDLSHLPEPGRYVLGAFIAIVNVITEFEKRLPLSDQDKEIYEYALECRRNLEQLAK